MNEKFLEFTNKRSGSERAKKTENLLHVKGIGIGDCKEQE